MLSVIICTYNRDKYIYNVLKSIAENHFPYYKYEIVLVNNNSTDQTASECERFQKAFPNVQFKYFIESQQGLSFARNRGIKESLGDMLIFLDDDAFIPTDYFSNLVNQLFQLPDLQAFGGRIAPLFESGTPPAWYSPISASFVSALNKGNNVKRFDKKSYPIGANMGFYKHCTAQTGEFNTALGRNKGNLMGGEEKDLFNRFKEQGFPIYYLPDVKAQHVIPESRTTYEYIAKLGTGVGISERIRCKKLGKLGLPRRYFAEIIKWGATITLYVLYTLSGQYAKGKVLFIFRKNVTQGLLTVNREQLAVNS